MLMSDESPMSTDARYYQRMLAGEPGDAWDLIEEYAKEHSRAEIFDAVMLPALTYARRDVLEGRLSASDEQAVAGLTKELLDVLAREPSTAATAPQPQTGAAAEVGAAETRLRVLGNPITGAADEAALEVLKAFLSDTSVELDISTRHQLVGEATAMITSPTTYDAICLVDIPPSPPSRLRYATKQLRRVLPTVPILIGRWAGGADVDAELRDLVDAGATHVASRSLRPGI